MKIKIRNEDFKMTFWLPLIFLKLKFIQRKINESIDFKNDESQINIKIIIKELRKYIKKNGHFVLLEVFNRCDNTYIMIKV